MDQSLQTLHIAKELQSVGKDLTTKVSELLNEVDSYTDPTIYCDRTFIAPLIKNDIDGNQLKTHLKKGETIFDKLQETIKRNDIVTNLEQLVEQQLEMFTNKIKQFKETIQQEKKKLIETNNEVLNNLEKLEMKRFNKLVKKEENTEMKKCLKEVMNDSLKSNFKSFKRKTIEEEDKENELIKRHQQFKDILKLDETKQLEEWIDLPIDRIIYDSNSEDWSIIGREESVFQQSIEGKENLIFILQNKKLKIGCYVKKRIEIGFDIYDRFGFMFVFNEKTLKFDCDEEIIKIYHPKKEKLLKILDDVEIMKRKKGETIKISDSSTDSDDSDTDSSSTDSDYYDLIDNFTPERMVILQCKETEEIKMKKREKRKDQLEQDKANVEEISSKVVEKISSEMNEVEETIGKKISELIFDSKCCDWSRHNTVFPDLLLNRQNLLILIENYNNQQIIVYLKKKITEIENMIEDDHLTIFSNLDGKYCNHEILSNN